MSKASVVAGLSLLRDKWAYLPKSNSSHLMLKYLDLANSDWSQHARAGINVADR